MSGPSAGLHLLDGVRVVDFTQALSGPYATMMLADLGADVVKVEAPGRGDDARHWGPPFVGDCAAYFASVNRNKRSVEVDLKTPHGVATACGLIMAADVVVENWRPGTAERLGIGPVRARELKPALIYASISGFGQDGAPLAGYDQIVQGTSGVMSLTGPAGRPTKWGVPSADICAGMFCATSVLAALYSHQQTGIGSTIDMSMQDALVSMLSQHAARFLATGEIPPKDDNGHSTICPYGAFAVADGFVNICVGNNAQFVRFCAALGLEHLGDDDRFSTNPLRNAHKSELFAIIGPVLAALSADQVIDRLQAAGVPVGPINDLADVVAAERTHERGLVLSWDRADGDRTSVIGGPWRFDDSTVGVRHGVPSLGEHTDQVLSEWNVSAD